MHILWFDPDGRLRVIWKITLFYVAYLAANLLLQLPLLPGPSIARGPLALTFVAGIAALLVTALAQRLEGSTMAAVGLRLDPRWWGHAALGTLGGILLMTLAALLLRALDGFHWERTNRFNPFGLVGDTLLFILVAIHEEVAFRGYPFQRLLQATRPWIALTLFATLFAWIHQDNPGMEGPIAAPALTNIALAGILLGLCFIKTRSLAAPMGLHLGWNWAQGTLLGFKVSGTTSAPGIWTPKLHSRPDWLTGGDIGIEGSVVCTVLCALAIGLLALWKPGPAPPTPAAGMPDPEVAPYPSP